MREIKDEVVKQLVEYSKEYFKNIDASFYEGMANILSNVGKRMQNVQVNASNKNEATNIPADLDLKIFDIVEEFYRSFNPTLGDMARNELRNSHVYMTKDNLSDEDIKLIEKNENNFKSEGDANYKNIPLKKSYEAVIIAAHECAHRFTFNDNSAIIPENKLDEDGYYNFDYSKLGSWEAHSISSIIEYILSETVAEYAELYCRDFIKEKYQITCNETLSNRYEEVSTFANKTEITEIELLRAMKEYVNLLKTEELSEDNMSEYKKRINKLLEIKEKIEIKIGVDERQHEEPINFENGRAIFILVYNYIFEPHRVGFIFANYLYQMSLDDSEHKVEIFNNMLSALSSIREFGDKSEEDFLLEYYSSPIIDSTIGKEELAYIEKTGLPLVKDGKLAIDDFGVQDILSAFDNALKRDKGLLKDRTEEEKKVTLRSYVKAAIKGGITESEVNNMAYTNLQSVFLPNQSIEEEPQNE